MTHDKIERKLVKNYGRFDRKGIGKRKASKAKRQFAKRLALAEMAQVTEANWRR